MVAGEPAAWIGAGEKEWKQKLKSAFELAPLDESPACLDVEFRLLHERLYSKDIDNLLTPVLESARDAGWIEKGFAQLGNITARKTPVADKADVCVVVTPHANAPMWATSRTGVLIETALEGLDQDSVKWSLYESALALYESRPELRFPPQCPLALDVRVTIDDAGRRKSISTLMKPCIDGLEPILGHPSNLPPEPRGVMKRRLAPQDEMVLDLAFHVRGGVSNAVAVQRAGA